MFWNLNPKKMQPFLKSFSNKVKREHDALNMLSWLIGAYSIQALASSFGKNNIYPSEPINLKESESISEKQTEKERQKFEAYVIAFNHEFKKRHPDTSEES